MAHSHHSQSSTRIAWAFCLNVLFTVIEFIGGWLTNSTAIMADAVHDLGDSLSIGSAWVLDRLGKKQADSDYTYGYRRLNLVGALINSLVLIAGSIWILVTAIPRLFAPVMPHTEGMLALAILGVAVNGFAAERKSAQLAFVGRCPGLGGSTDCGDGHAIRGVAHSRSIVINRFYLVYPG